MDNELYLKLRSLETELHRLETRRNRRRLEQLLHPDFFEFARDGRRYGRGHVLAEFSSEGAFLPPVVADQFEMTEITSGAVLLTYLSAHRTPAGELYRHTLRSSLWVKTGDEWRMRFHQGTPASEVLDGVST